MKKFRKKTWIVFLFLATMGFAQLTPEQKKMVEEAEKRAAKAQKMQDSLMNTPEMKQIMEQMEVMEAQYEKERQKHKQQEKNGQPQETEKTNVGDQGHLKHLIITVGNTKKFNDWLLGPQEITIATHKYKGGDVFDKRTVGQINAGGSFTITLPESMNVKTDDPPITNYFHTSSDGTNDNKTQYTGKDTHISRASLRIGGSNEDMGSLYLATSRQQVFNHSPAGRYRGDVGYRISIWYANDHATVKASTTRIVEATDHGEIIKNIPMTKAYDLTIKPGLNFIKEQVVGTQYVGNIPYYQTMRYTTLDELPNDVKWVYSKY